MMERIYKLNGNLVLGSLTMGSAAITGALIWAMQHKPAWLSLWLMGV